MYFIIQMIFGPIYDFQFGEGVRGFGVSNHIRNDDEVIRLWMIYGTVDVNFNCFYIIKMKIIKWKDDTNSI